MALFKKDVLQTAEKLVQKGKIEAAIKEYKKVVAKTPGDTNTLNRVGDLYVRLRKHSDAVEYYMKTAERYALDGFYVKAIAVYKKVQRIDTSAVEVHGRLADLYAKQGLINEARSHLDQLADHHLRKNDTGSAISVYEKIVDLDKDNPTPLLRLADLYRENDQPSKATESYERIATLMLARGQVDHAVQVYERALNIEAGNLDFISQAVLKIRDAGGADRALDLIARAEKANPAASELRNLVHAPKSGNVVGGSEGLAPLEDVADLPTAAFVPPQLPKAAGSSDVPSSPAEDAAPSHSLDNLEDDRQQSTPSLVDPSTFVTEEEEPIPTPTEAEPTLDVPPPMEPFALGGPQSLPTPSAPEAPSFSLPDQSVQEAGALDLTASGEIDLGELGQIDEVAGDLEPSVEMPDTPEGADDTEEVDLDAAFDRQVDPGPIDLSDESSSEMGDVPGQLEPFVSEPEPTQVQPDPAQVALEEKLSEAGVFRKYGLLDKALDRLNEILALAPDHLEALSQAIQVLVERGDEARASTKAETLHLLCAQRNERELWGEVQDLLVNEGYQIDGDRVRAPGELAVLQGTSVEEAPSTDPYDQDPSASQKLDTEDFSALAGEPLNIDPADQHDMLDSKEIPIQSVPEDDEQGEGPAEVTLPPLPAPGEVQASESEVAEADESTPTWLDAEDPSESSEADDLFDDEEEFFDLAAEMQDELGTGLTDLEESLPENAAEQSLEEIVEGFKQGVADNISEEESDTHYNLGIAYREMMLLDEAINEFQISAKSSDYVVDSCAMLGLCFQEKGLPDLSAKWYLRAVEAPELAEEQRVGMLYELACALEDSGDREEARNRFIQVASKNDGYRDVKSKLDGLSDIT